MKALKITLLIVIALLLLPILLIATDMLLNPPNSPWGPNHLYPFNEVVLSPGMKVAAENKNGKFSIEYVDEVRRKFTWDDQSVIVKMIPRTERFLGKIGIYNPASTWFWDSRIRLVTREEQIHLNSSKEAQEWLVVGSAIMDWVYTDDGLVAGFAKTPQRNQINVDLFQMFINGECPAHLDGARPEKIKLEKETMAAD